MSGDYNCWGVIDQENAVFTNVIGKKCFEPLSTVYIKLPEGTIKQHDCFPTDRLSQHKIYSDFGMIISYNNSVYFIKKDRLNIVLQNGEYRPSNEDVLIIQAVSLIGKGTTSHNNTVIAFPIIKSFSLNCSDSRYTQFKDVVIFNSATKKTKICKGATQASHIADDIFAFIDQQGNMSFEKITFE